MITEIMCKFAAALDKKDAAVAGTLGTLGLANTVRVGKNNLGAEVAAAQASRSEKIKALMDACAAKSQPKIDALSDQIKKNTAAMNEALAPYLEATDAISNKKYDEIYDAFEEKADALHKQRKAIHDKREKLNKWLLARKERPINLPLSTKLKAVAPAAALSALPATAYLAYRKLSKD